MSEHRKRSTSTKALNGARDLEQNGLAASAESSPRDPLAFEEALGRLDETVAALESGQLPLEEALKIFEEGVRLTQRCQELLDTAELRVQRLRVTEPEEDDVTGQLITGAFSLEPFDLEDE